MWLIQRSKDEKLQIVKDGYEWRKLFEKENIDFTYVPIPKPDKEIKELHEVKRSENAAYRELPVIPYNGPDRYWVNFGNGLALFLTITFSFLPMVFAGLFGYYDTFFELWIDLNLMPPECIEWINAVIIFK